LLGGGTVIGIADILLALKWCWSKREDDQDEDAAQVEKEITAQILFRWDARTDDLTKQSDACV
jgi:hypothetical protein